MRKIIILILLIWPNFSVADQGLEITCVNMKSALFGRKYKPLNFKLGKLKKSTSIMIENDYVIN